MGNGYINSPIILVLMETGARTDYASVEMSGAAISIILNQGTINIWFGRNAEKSLISRVLLTIARVDSTAEHEREAICSFEEISRFENNGYVLTSYARKKDKYRAVFIVPFSDQRALDNFIESICQELGHSGVRMNIFWRGGRARMSILYEELNRLNYFSFSNITYKGDQKKDQ